MTQIENEQIKSLGEKLEVTNRHIIELTAGFKVLETALIGNEIAKDGGMVKRLADLEQAQEKSNERHENAEDWQKKVKWIGTLLIALFAIIEVLYQSTEIIEFITGHKK